MLGGFNLYSVLKKKCFFVHHSDYAVCFFFVFLGNGWVGGGGRPTWLLGRPSRCNWRHPRCHPSAPIISAKPAAEMQKMWGNHRKRRCKNANKIHEEKNSKVLYVKCWWVGLFWLGHVPSSLWSSLNGQWPLVIRLIWAAAVVVRIWLTDWLTGVGARDATASKNRQLQSIICHGKSQIVINICLFMSSNSCSFRLKSSFEG